MSDKLPRKVAERTDKMGYVTPEEIWAKKDAPDIFMKEIKRALEQSKGKLNNELVLKSASKILYGTVPYDPAIWRIISFGAWMDRFAIE